MKKLYIIALFGLGVAVSGNAQTLERQVIGSAGGFDTDPSSGVSLSFTVGEPIIETAQSGSLILTQGFQQPDSIGTSVGISQVQVTVDYTVYPNPTLDKIFVVLKSSQETNVILDMYDITGRKLDNLTTKVNVVGTATQELSLKNLAASSYILVMSDMQGKELKNFKIEKLNN